MGKGKTFNKAPRKTCTEKSTDHPQKVLELYKDVKLGGKDHRRDVKLGGRDHQEPNTYDIKATNVKSIFYNLNNSSPFTNVLMTFP